MGYHSMGYHSFDCTPKLHLNKGIGQEHETCNPGKLQRDQVLLTLSEVLKTLPIFLWHRMFLTQSDILNSPCSMIEIVVIGWNKSGQEIARVAYHPFKKPNR
jgi:hypothetical protein